MSKIKKFAQKTKAALEEIPALETETGKIDHFSEEIPEEAIILDGAPLIESDALGPKYQSEALGKAIDIDLDMPSLVAQIRETNDLGVLMETLKAEGSNGRRLPVMQAINAQMEKNNPSTNQGEGSQAPEDDDIWSEIKKSRRYQDEIEMGKGSEPTPQTMQEREKLSTQKEEYNRRINDFKKLSEHYPEADGTLVFNWGFIKPPLETIKDDKGNVTRRGHDFKLVLKSCPRCGFINKPMEATQGICGKCNLEFMTVMNRMIEKKVLPQMKFEAL